jgi:hypothetical protein
MTISSLSQHYVDTPKVKALYADGVEFCAYRPISRLYRLHIVLNIADAMSCAIFFLLHFAIYRLWFNLYRPSGCQNRLGPISFPHN